MLGKGQFGEVRAGEVVIDDKKIPVAVKIVIPTDSLQTFRTYDSTK